jgi:3-deoxy-D-manno-octulosonate 8-phosphate phosphatase (KDO 8-P phosphatase)
VTPEQVCYTGDDIVDLPVMLRVGLAIAPANAHPWVSERAHWHTRLAGGVGAAREVCDLLLIAQGKAEAELARWL